MIIESSWDDGSKWDEKLVALLQKYEIPAVLYVPVRCEIGLKRIKEFSKLKGIEIGGHTFSHPTDLKLLREDFLKVEIEKAKEMMEISIEKEITKFCYPRGRYNSFVKGMVKMAGYMEARTTKVLETDYPKDLFEKGTSIHVFKRKEYGESSWLDMAYRLFHESFVKKSYFHLWGHSWEVEKYHQWENLELFFKFLKKYL